jgi:iron complex transport system substrate-binding protein
VRSGEGAMYPLFLGTLLYPELFSDIDMKKVVRDFFKNFYVYDVSDAEINRILTGETTLN